MRHWRLVRDYIFKVKGAAIDYRYHKAHAESDEALCWAISPIFLNGYFRLVSQVEVIVLLYIAMWASGNTAHRRTPSGDFNGDVHNTIDMKVVLNNIIIYDSTADSNAPNPPLPPLPPLPPPTFCQYHFIFHKRLPRFILHFLCSNSVQYKAGPRYSTPTCDFHEPMQFRPGLELREGALDILLAGFFFVEISITIIN